MNAQHFHHIGEFFEALAACASASIQIEPFGNVIAENMTMEHWEADERWEAWCRSQGISPYICFEELVEELAEPTYATINNAIQGKQRLNALVLEPGCWQAHWFQPGTPWTSEEALHQALETVYPKLRIVSYDEFNHEYNMRIDAHVLISSRNLVNQ